MRVTWKIGFLISLLVGMGSLFSGVSQADFEVRDSHIMKFGTVEVGLQTGHWQAITAVGNADSANRSAVVVMPHIGVVVTDEIELGLMSGVFEVAVEPVGASFYQPFSASLFGVVFVGEYNFLSFGRWMPYWDWGVGVSWTDLAPRVPEQSTSLEFLLETGPGIQYFLTEDTALSAAVRLQHMSNGNVGDRNVGINAVLGLFGFSFYIP